MAKVSFVASSATTYDLTSVSTNPMAAAEVTPREGGFVARNRIPFSSITAPTLTNKVMNVLKLLKIPDRSVITDVYLSAPRGGAAVTHATNSKSVESATVGIGAIIYRSASHTSVVASMNSVFAKATVAKTKFHTSSVLALPADPETSGAAAVRYVGAGVAGGNQGWADGGADGQVGVYFPYGGYIKLQILAGKGASGVAASSLDGKFSGTLEVSARGFKIPE